MRASRFVFFRSALVLVVAAALAGPTRAKADFQLVTSLNALGANDAASWSGFDVNNPTIVSTNGINVSVQNGVVDPNLSLTTLSGSPAIAEFGGETFGTFGPSSSASINLTFSQPVTAAGALMEAFEENGSFALGIGFQITAFDSIGNSQSFQVGGNGGSPEFVGIVSDTGNLTSLIISAFAFNANTLVEVGSLGLQDTPSLPSVPAPSGFTVASVGVLGLLGWSCWCRRRPALA
jgi:hypothetical protein